MLWRPEDKYAGWAADAHPEMTRDDLYTMVRRMLDHGANLLWIGHNNPGDVDAAKWEPALSYAVYESYVDEASALHSAAVSMLDAQYRLLDVCRELGMRVVFPVGYQIQMGRLWNEKHPDDLRCDTEGRVIDWGGVSASFYSQAYREDISRFYEWVVPAFIEPYRDTILMVNLADEPFGGDYSTAAEKAFRERYGFGFGDVGENPDRHRQLGRFQSDYVVGYARWSAEAWGEICPDVPCTMSFCGWHGRLGNTFPTVPALFSDTPANFHVTFDAYPRDGLPSNIIAETDVTSLLVFLRQIGCLSERHDRPLWLWSTGNSWGLAQASTDKADIADAIANQYHLAMLPTDAGARLAGIAVWNYNIKSQGLYLDTNPIVYDPDDVFRKVSATFPLVRDIASSGARAENDVVFHAPAEYEFDTIGRERRLYSFKLYDLESLSVVAKNVGTYTLVEDLDAYSLRAARVFISLAPDARYFTEAQKETVCAFVSAGGRFVGHRELVRSFFGDAADAPAICQGDEELPDVRKASVDSGEVYAVSGSIESTFNDLLDCHYRRFWQELLELARTTRAYVVRNGERTIVYNLSGRSLPAGPLVSDGGKLKVYDRHGDLRVEVGVGDSTERIQHHEIGLEGF